MIRDCKWVIRKMCIRDRSWDNQVDFKPLLESDPEVTSRLTQEEIDEIFNPVYYTKRVDEIFERIGLGD